MLLPLSNTGHAQVSVTGEFRPRTEYRNGYRIPRTADTDPAFFTSQRTRLSLEYETDSYWMKISGQDVRTWGDSEQLGDQPNVNIHEAWALVRLSNHLGIKPGRQELVYGDQRLLGSVNWTQQARSHDAMVVTYRNPNYHLRLDAGGAFNQESQHLLGNAYQLDNYKVLSYVWLDKQWGAFALSSLGLTDGFERTNGTTVFRYTYGADLKYIGNRSQLSGSLYGQNGDDTLRDNISAWMYSLQAAYTVDPFTITAGIDHLSGGDPQDSNPFGQTFNTLYATNHKFYGHMDYFLNIPNDTRGAGLRDIYLKADYELSDNATVNAAYHLFSLSGSTTNPLEPTEILDGNLGSELDAQASFTVNSEMKLNVGYSVLMSTETLRDLKQQNSAPSWQHWGWVMLSITPRFL
ncbi:MAG: alginate export family protein [Bacteroidota bacterium]